MLLMPDCGVSVWRVIDFDGVYRRRTQLLDGRLQLVQVRLVLPLVLDLFLDALEDADGGGVVVDLSGALSAASMTSVVGTRS